MYFVPILHRNCKSKTNFSVFSYDKISLKFCASFRFFLALFMEKFQKILYLSYVRRGLVPIYLTCYKRWHQIESCYRQDETTLQFALIQRNPNLPW